MQTKRKFTDQQFLELYNKGLNDRQIAEILNVSGSFIARKRWKHGLTPKNPKKKSNPKLSYEKLKEKNKRSDKKTNQRPERKEAKRLFRINDYNKRPEVIAKRRIQSIIREQTPERKAQRKAYNNRPEVKAKQKALRIKYYHKKHPNAKYRRTTNQTKT